MKIRCPHGHLVADVTHDCNGWIISIPADEWVTLGDDGKVTTMSRYPERELLNARPERMLACPRECMRTHSWYRVESAEAQRRADAGTREWRLTA